MLSGCLVRRIWLKQCSLQPLCQKINKCMQNDQFTDLVDNFCRVGVGCLRCSLWQNLIYSAYLVNWGYANLKKSMDVNYMHPVIKDQCMKVLWEYYIHTIFWKSINLRLTRSSGPIRYSILTSFGPLIFRKFNSVPQILTKLSTRIRSFVSWSWRLGCKPTFVNPNLQNMKNHIQVDIFVSCKDLRHAVTKISKFNGEK